MAQHVQQSSWTQKDSEAEFLFRMQQHQLEQRGLDGGANVGRANVDHGLGNSARPLFSKVGEKKYCEASILKRPLHRELYIVNILGH